MVRTRIEQLSDIEREKYVVDNVEQLEELADQLQFLVGQSYFDDESGYHYKVESIKYHDRHRAVIAHQRALDGRMHWNDDASYLIYGDGGVLPLVDLWGVDQGETR